MSNTFPIDGIPDEPGVYESKMFPLGTSMDYAPYYKYADGAFHESDRHDEVGALQKINGHSEAQSFGPFRKVRDLTPEEEA